MNKRIKLIPRFKDNIIETLDVNEMVGKYITENVCRIYKEDFVDESTGETVTLERRELLFERREVTKDLASQIDFHIQAGDITTPIKLSSVRRISKLNDQHWYRPIMVQVSTGLAKPWLLCYASSFTRAMEVASDYFEQIDTTGSFFIIDVKNLKYNLVDRKEDSEKQEEHAEKCELSLNTLRFYTVNAMWKEADCPVPFVNTAKSAKEVFIREGKFLCMADSFENAIEVVAPEISKIAYEDDKWKQIKVHYEKGSPFSPSIIVPKDFCDEYEAYFKALEKLN